jgi:subtilisin family serine protease
MDAVFEAQFRLMRDDFARRGIQIEVALGDDGEADYLYRAGQLITLATEQNLSLLRNALPGLRGVQRELRPDGELTVFTSDALMRNEISVPEALDRIDASIGKENPAFREGGLPTASPDHIVHVSRICPAVEPEVPAGSPVTPWPAPRASCGSATREILIGISDTGLLENLDPSQYPWLSDVTGEPDPLAPVPGGSSQISEYAAHGTFVAGVAKCEAPQARVLVNNHFTASGGELESEMIRKVLELARHKPDVINLSAGTYTRNDWTSLGFSIFNRRHPEIAFVAAAGNDNTSRPFWPAAFDWVVSVGALATDQQHRAWFSNHGRWVDVYALGEGMINAYATGDYTYNEPPKAPATQSFKGMARWDGTSFSAPLVAGLIAERMARTTDTAIQATEAVLKLASNQVVAGVGPALFPGDSA